MSGVGIPWEYGMDDVDPKSNRIPVVARLAFGKPEGDSMPCKITFRLPGSRKQVFSSPMYIQVHPAGCPTCAKVVSLMPEISEESGRVN